MNRTIGILLILLASSVRPLNFARASEPLNVAPREGILVLRSGGILRGAITRAGQEYYVGIDGGEIRLKVDDVELACESLDEAYRLKAVALPTGHVSEHVALAEWCLRQNLFGYAAKELVLAREADPNYPKLTLLERRLEVAQRPVEPQVTGALPKPPEAIKDPAADLLQRIHPRSLESFTSTIQPLLLNGCAAAACHGTTSNNRLRLERISLGRPTSYRISQRNLASVLSCVDMENPANSLLLTLPLGAHGSMADAAFTRRDMDKYRQLVAWVTDVTNNTIPAPSNVSTPATPLLQTMSQRVPGAATARQSTSTPTPRSSAARPSQGPANTEEAGLEPSDTDLAEEEIVAADEQPMTVAPAGTLRAAQESRGNKFGAPTPETKPADPFDPELFNRQFGAGR